MNARRKWLIRAKETLTDKRRKQYWEKTHKDDGYETVWSITGAPDFCERICQEVSILPEFSTILLPGCGSKVELQNSLAESLPITRICGTDYGEVVALAEKEENHAAITYVVRDSKALGFSREWDVILIVNSILSESDLENRQILDSCFKALKPGGMLVGVFPTIFSAVDIALVEGKSEWLDLVDLNRSSFKDPVQGVTQVFYTPLRLRRILMEANFQLKKMEVLFLDSDYFADHAKEYYGLTDPDTPIYEYLVVAQRPESAIDLGV